MKLRKRKREHVFTDVSAMDIRVLDEALCDMFEKTKRALETESDPELRKLYGDKQSAAWSMLRLVLHVRGGDCDGTSCYHTTA